MKNIVELVEAFIYFIVGNYITCVKTNSAIIQHIKSETAIRTIAVSCLGDFINYYITE